MQALIVDVVPNYSLSNEEYWEKVCSLPSFSLCYSDVEKLKKAPRSNMEDPEKEFGTIFIYEGTNKSRVLKKKITETDFPTFCEILIKNYNYFHFNSAKFVWRLASVCCSMGLLFVNRFPLQCHTCNVDSFVPNKALQ